MSRTGLRVGLTGGLGSGKSTAAALFAELGAQILAADEIGRALMQPGESVYAAILEHFGPSILEPNGQLDRPAVARIAFAEGRAEELNRLVHPATIARQQQLAEAIFAANPEAIVIVESALIFESKYGAGWRDRFDRLILVTAPEALKIARFVARAGSADISALEAEARRRLAQMIPDQDKLSQVDFVLHNDGSLAYLRDQVTTLWATLQ